GDEQYADVLALDQFRDILDDAGAHDCVERRERLIHQQQLGRARQHLRERDAFALAAAEMTRETVAEARQSEPFQPLLRLFARLALWHAVQGEAERDVLARGLPRQQRVVLKQDADLRGRNLGLDRPLQWRLQPDRGPQQARLAGTRRADQAHELAVADRDARSFEDRLAAVGNRQVADAQRSAPRDAGVEQPGNIRVGLEQA